MMGTFYPLKKIRSGQNAARVQALMPVPMAAVYYVVDVQSTNLMLLDVLVEVRFSSANRMTENLS